jgi:hypothetical protein
MTSVSLHACYDNKDEAVILQAKDRAREQGKSLSAYIVHLIKKDLAENKEQVTVSILNRDSQPRQTTISEYDIHLFEPPKVRMAKIQNLSKEQQTKLAIEALDLRRQIEAARKR